MFFIRKDALETTTTGAPPARETSRAAESPGPGNLPGNLSGNLMAHLFQPQSGIPSRARQETIGQMLVQLSEAMGGDDQSFDLPGPLSETPAVDGLSAMAGQMLNFITLMVGETSGSDVSSLSAGETTGKPGEMALLSRPDGSAPVEDPQAIGATDALEGVASPDGVAASATVGPATTSNDPVELPDMEQQNDLAGTVMARRQLARIAMSLGLPDHAVWILMSAFNEVRNSLDGVLAQLDDAPPSGRVLTYVESLRNLKDKVLMDMRMALADNGGPELTMAEVEALVARDQDYDGSRGAGATQALKHFNRNVNKEALMKNTGSAMDKLGKSLLTLLTGVAKSLLDLHATAGQDRMNIGRGGAVDGVNSALTRLDQIKAIMRVMKAGRNSFKDKLMASLPVGEVEKLIEQLSLMADQVFQELIAKLAKRTGGAESPTNTLRALERGLRKMNAERERQGDRRNGLSPLPAEPGLDEFSAPGEDNMELRFGMNVSSITDGSQAGGFPLSDFSNGGSSLSSFSMNGFSSDGPAISGFSLSGFTMQS